MGISLTASVLLGIVDKQTLAFVGKFGKQHILDSILETKHLDPSPESRRSEEICTEVTEKKILKTEVVQSFYLFLETSKLRNNKPFLVDLDSHVMYVGVIGRCRVTFRHPY